MLRTIEDITTDYNGLAARTGDRAYRIQALQTEQAEDLKAMGALQTEAATLAVPTTDTKEA